VKEEFELLSSVKRVQVSVYSERRVQVIV